MLAVFVVLRPRNVKIVLTPLLLSPVVTRSVDRVTTGESNAIGHIRPSSGAARIL